MADAEVIPLGARGRPGRGGNRSRTPSSAARSLAGTRSGSRPKRQPPTTSDQETTPPATTAKSSAAKKSPRAGKSTSTGASNRTSKTQTRPRRRPAATEPSTPAAPPPPTSITPPAEDVFVRGRGGRVGFDVAAALGNAAREIFGDNWEDGLAELLAFARRRITGEYVVDEYGFDADLTTRLSMAAVRPLVEKWFRVDVQGIENIPADGGALLVGNHSGTVPIDGLVTSLVVHDHADRYLRMLAADLVFRLPFVGEMARKGGATLACNEDAERLLGQGELVGVWPEGFKGVGKPFSERYTLQRFGRGGFVSAALRTRVPIVPCSIVGAEEIYPLVGNLPTLARLLGVPYIPITPFFPWLGPLGMIPLPSKWLIEFGEPIRTDALTDEQVEDPMIVFNLTDQVRETIQQTLYALLMQRRNVFF